MKPRLGWEVRRAPVLEHEYSDGGWSCLSLKPYNFTTDFFEARPPQHFLSPHTNLWLLVASTHSNVLEQWSCTCFLSVALAFMAVIYAWHNCGKP